MHLSRAVGPDMLAMRKSCICSSDQNSVNLNQNCMRESSLMASVKKL